MQYGSSWSTRLWPTSRARRAGRRAPPRRANKALDHRFKPSGVQVQDLIGSAELVRIERRADARTQWSHVSLHWRHPDAYQRQLPPDRRGFQRSELVNVAGGLRRALTCRNRVAALTGHSDHRRRRGPVCCGRDERAVRTAGAAPGSSESPARATVSGGAPVTSAPRYPEAHQAHNFSTRHR